MEVCMIRRRSREMLCLVVIAGVACTGVLQARQDTKKSSATSAATAAGAKASPELVGQLSKEMAATPEQAAGAAGALFGVAKSRLKPEEFSQVSAAVPGMGS